MIDVASVNVDDLAERAREKLARGEHPTGEEHAALAREIDDRLVSSALSEQQLRQLGLAVLGDSGVVDRWTV